MGGGGSSMREVKLIPTKEQRPVVNYLGVVVKEGFKYKKNIYNFIIILLLLIIILFFIYYKLRYKKI
jgi:hypothetical protein